METKENLDIKDRISETAFGLFCLKGVKSISMDDIAQHLSMSKKTIYKWYSNKDEIIYASTKNYLHVVERESECFAGDAKNAVEELFSIMGMTRKIMSSIHPAVFHDLQKYHASSWKLWQDHKNKFMLGKIKQNLLRGIEEGLFRKDLDVEVISKLRLAQIEIIFDNRIFPPHEFNLEQVQLAALEHFMLGIATLKGHKLINEYKHITEEE
ncbi:TetR/AcrR family transcriptional regulator [Pontibacter ruber]|uniref:TetR/AcrR family transcriptional regulator n=1 Tax=Pontibacter ruber TaxID=1343895 RepID=A0ABW5CWR0_9BACT|nr:TetR/AcrR family transcriptional regulator [Pontibacter ruber]